MSSRRAPDDRLSRSLLDLVIVIAGSIRGRNNPPRRL
jgi:hypothetical protein